MDTARTLGERIVEAARLATVLHLEMECEQQSRQQASGGAGERFSTDGKLPVVNHRKPRWRFVGRRAA